MNNHVNIGGTAVLEIQISGSPNISIKCYKNEKLLLLDRATGRIRLEHSAEGCIRLIIEDLCWSDEGSYSVVVENDTERTIIGPVPLEIENGSNIRRTSAPYILQDLIDTKVGIGAKCTLEVRTDLESNDVFWFKNKKTIQHNKRISTHSDGTTHRLTIDDAQLSDTGEFYCQISNTFGGITSRTAIVDVQDFSRMNLDNIEGKSAISQAQYIVDSERIDYVTTIVNDSLSTDVIEDNEYGNYFVSDAVMQQAIHTENYEQTGSNQQSIVSTNDVVFSVDTSSAFELSHEKCDVKGEDFFDMTSKIKRFRGGDSLNQSTAELIETVSVARTTQDYEEDSYDELFESVPKKVSSNVEQADKVCRANVGESSDESEAHITHETTTGESSLRKILVDVDSDTNIDVSSDETDRNRSAQTNIEGKPGQSNNRGRALYVHGPIICRDGGDEPAYYARLRQRKSLTPLDSDVSVSATIELPPPKQTGHNIDVEVILRRKTTDDKDSDCATSPFEITVTVTRQDYFFPDIEVVRTMSDRAIPTMGSSFESIQGSQYSSKEKNDKEDSEDDNEQQLILTDETQKISLSSNIKRHRQSFYSDEQVEGATDETFNHFNVKEIGHVIESTKVVREHYESSLEKAKAVENAEHRTIQAESFQTSQRPEIARSSEVVRDSIDIRPKSQCRFDFESSFSSYQSGNIFIPLCIMIVLLFILLFCCSCITIFSSGAFVNIAFP